MGLLEHLISLLVGIFWACLFSVRALIGLIVAGPSKYFYINKTAPRPKELDNESYGQHQIINLKTIKLHFVISGPESSPLMVMLHGFPEIWYSWRHQIVEFQKDFRVVALDMRGYGESDRPKGLKDYKMNTLTEDVKQLIEALGYKSCVLLSHDWGGAVAWAFANQYPDMVDRLVVMNMCPAPIWWKTIISDVKQFICSGYVFFFFLPFLPEFLMSKNDFNIFNQMFNEKPVGLKSGPVTADEIECYKYYFRKPGSLTSGINYYRANLKTPRVTHSLKYPMPVHVIWGDSDPFLSRKLLDKTIKSVPGMTWTIVDESSHWVQNDRPDKVNKAVREFLENSKYNFVVKS